jgi:hypothetical protein
MKYELVGRMVFEAENVEDAFRKLAEHFLVLASGMSSSALPISGTQIQVRRVGAVPPPLPAQALPKIPGPPPVPKELKRQAANTVSPKRKTPAPKSK